MNTSFKSFKAKLIIIKKKFVLKSLHKKILNNQFNSLNGQAKMALMVQFSKLPKIFPEPSLKFRDALSWHFAGDPSLRSMVAMKRPRKLLKDWGGGDSWEVMTLGRCWFTECEASNSPAVPRKQSCQCPCWEPEKKSLRRMIGHHHSRTTDNLVWFLWVWGQGVL